MNVENHVVYGYEPMTRQLADRIKDLRIDQKRLHENIPFYLNEGFDSDFLLGKELCKKAQIFLKEENEPWD